MKELTINERVLALREAGLVMRGHTVSYHGVYNIAIHSFNAVNLLLLLCPTASLNLIKAVLWHDVPERWTGDVPSPAKWSSPSLKEALDNLEKMILLKLSLYQVFENLTDNEKHWLNGVDLLELYLWAEENKQEGIANRVACALEEQRLILPIEITRFMANHNLARLPECDEFLEIGGAYDKSK